MEKQEYFKHYTLEQEHWWFAGRREIILGALRSLELQPARALLLDVGCGTGLNLKILKNFGEAYGFDLQPEAIDFCRQRGLRQIVRADAQNIPFRDGLFDVVLFLDVLYHRNIASDLAALRDAHRVLKKGGRVLLTDSAFRFLWSRHDLAVHARERYTRRRLKERLERAGFQVTEAGYFQFFLFPPLVMSRLWHRLKREKAPAPVSDLRPLTGALNSALFFIFRAEAFLLRHIRFPFGSSLLCVARKI
jgi:SAM-dependent methyltransferase